MEHKLKKCFGIISWFPNAEPARTQRQERINRLFKQLDKFWPNVDILVIAQNWQNFRPVNVRNKIIRKSYYPLGILKARKTLREEFLKLDYDYVIMMDDDAIIFSNGDAHIKYMEEIDKHPNGFCFIHGPKRKHDSYAQAQLNLCAISRYIYEKEDIPNVNPQNNEGYEDHIYSVLLHYKYADNEFLPPSGIKHIQFQNAKETAPSTWCKRSQVDWVSLNTNTSRIVDYIAEYKDLPDLDRFFESFRRTGRGDLGKPKKFTSYLDLFL